MISHLKRKIKRHFSLSTKESGDRAHPWYNGLPSKFSIPSDVSLTPPEDNSSTLGLFSSPIMFLARGHSGTAVLSKILEKAGVYMGNINSAYSLNSTYDSLYWSYGFQRFLLPKFFKYGQGCYLNINEALKVGSECLMRHLSDYENGLWGFKTCEGMFAHTLYRGLFPGARYIYLVRDGRDVILSNNGYLHLVSPASKFDHWEYFKITTFGISNDMDKTPFEFSKTEAIVNNRFWIQAKSWIEHVRMVEHLRKNNLLSPNVYLMKYEDLCTNPMEELKRVFDFIGIELTMEVKQYATKSLYTSSIGRWKNYKKYISDYSENVDEIFRTMEPELKLMGYI